MNWKTKIDDQRPITVVRVIYHHCLWKKFKKSWNKICYLNFLKVKKNFYFRKSTTQGTEGPDMIIQHVLCLVFSGSCVLYFQQRRGAAALSWDVAASAVHLWALAHAQWPPGTAQGLLCCVAFQTFQRFKCQSCSLVGHNVPGRYSAVLVNFSVRHGKRKREERSSTSTRPQQFLLFQRPRGPGQQWLPMCDEVFNENFSNIRNHVILHQIWNEQHLLSGWGKPQYGRPAGLCWNEFFHFIWHNGFDKCTGCPK